jgi:hypothetical protein
MLNRSQLKRVESIGRGNTYEMAQRQEKISSSSMRTSSKRWGMMRVESDKESFGNPVTYCVPLAYWIFYISYLKTLQQPYEKRYYSASVAHFHLISLKYNKRWQYLRAPVLLILAIHAFDDRQDD